MATKKSHMDAVELLKADHRAVEELFEKFEKARSDRKEAIAEKICLELSIHTTIEEEIFYPACRDVIDDDMLDEAYVEHDGAKSLIAELVSSRNNQFRDAKVTVLGEMIKHHVKEEEQRDGIFAQAKKSDLDLEQLGEQMKARKEELQQQLSEDKLPLPTTRSMTGKAPIRGDVLDASAHHVR